MLFIQIACSYYTRTSPVGEFIIVDKFILLKKVYLFIIVIGGVSIEIIK